MPEAVTHHEEDEEAEEGQNSVCPSLIEIFSSFPNLQHLRIAIKSSDLLRELEDLNQSMTGLERRLSFTATACAYLQTFHIEVIPHCPLIDHHNSFTADYGQEFEEQKEQKKRQALDIEAIIRTISDLFPTLHSLRIDLNNSTLLDKSSLYESSSSSSSAIPVHLQLKTLKITGINTQVHKLEPLYLFAPYSSSSSASSSAPSPQRPGIASSVIPHIFALSLFPHIASLTLRTNGNGFDVSSVNAIIDSCKKYVRSLAFDFDCDSTPPPLSPRKKPATPLPVEAHTPKPNIKTLKIGLKSSLLSSVSTSSNNAAASAPDSPMSSASSIGSLCSSCSLPLSRESSHGNEELSRTSQEALLSAAAAQLSPQSRHSASIDPVALDEHAASDNDAQGHLDPEHAWPSVSSFSPLLHTLQSKCPSVKRLKLKGNHMDDLMGRIISEEDGDSSGHGSSQDINSSIPAVHVPWINSLCDTCRRSTALEELEDALEAQMEHQIQSILMSTTAQMLNAVVPIFPALEHIKISAPVPDMLLNSESKREILSQFTELRTLIVG